VELSSGFDYKKADDDDINERLKEIFNGKVRLEAVYFYLEKEIFRMKRSMKKLPSIQEGKR